MMEKAADTDICIYLEMHMKQCIELHLPHYDVCYLNEVVCGKRG